MMRRSEAFHDDVNQLKNHETDERNKSCCDMEFRAADSRKRRFMDGAEDKHECRTNESTEYENGGHSSNSANDNHKCHLMESDADDQKCHFIDSAADNGKLLIDSANDENGCHSSGNANGNKNCHSIKSATDNQKCRFIDSPYASHSSDGASTENVSCINSRVNDEYGVVKKEAGCHENVFPFAECESLLLTKAGSSKEIQFDNSSKAVEENQCAANMNDYGVEQKMDPLPDVKHEITLAKVNYGASKDNELLQNESTHDRNESQLSDAALNDYWRARNTGGSGLSQDNEFMRILEDDSDDQCDDDDNDNERDALDAQNFVLLKNDSNITIKNECDDNDPNIKVVHPTTSDQVCPEKYLRKEKVFSCDHCEKAFTRRNNLLRHIRMDHEFIYFEKYFCQKESKLSCNHCDKSFTLRSNLNRHIRTVHQKVKPISCPFFASTTMQNLKQNCHQMHSCELCQLMFKNKPSLDSHIKEAHQNEQHICKLCEKRFDRLSTLKMHLQAVHENRGPFICDVCGISITQEAELAAHVKSTKCGKAFFKKYSLSFLFNFPCNLCEQSFISLTELTEHTKTTHHRKKNKTYSCEECSAVFTTHSSFILHQLKHEEIPCFRCSHCDSAFSTKKKLKDHLNISHGY